MIFITNSPQFIKSTETKERCVKCGKEKHEHYYSVTVGQDPICPENFRKALDKEKYGDDFKELITNI